MAGGLWLGLGVGGAPPAEHAGAAGARSGVRHAAMLSISRYLGKSSPAYWAQRDGSGWAVSRRLGHYTVGYSPTGAKLTAGGSALQFVAPAGASAGVNANRVTYRAAAESEWFSDGPAGLEQGWTLQSPPQAAARGGEITLPVTTAGTLRPVAHDGQIEFENAAGRPELAYGGLSATDAHGHDLKASLTLSSGRLQVQVAARGASYPIVVDPTITAVYSDAVLQDGGTQQINNTSLGQSVASDGNTIVVGEPDGAPCNSENYPGGQLDVFTEPSGGWSGTLTPAAILGNPQDSETTSCDDGTASHYGDTVAIATVNGVQRIVAGAPDDSDGDGAVYTYNEPSGGWGALSTPYFGFTQSLDTEDSDLNGQGTSVAIDDNTIAVGDVEAQDVGGIDDAGVVDLYQLNDSSWEQVASLSSSDENNDGAEIGTSVALADTSYGTVVVSGAPAVSDPQANGGDGGEVGGALVWVEPAGGWDASNDGNPSDNTDPTTLLRDDAGNASGNDGAAVAIDPSGSPIAVGENHVARDSESDAGTAFVYMAPASSGGWGDAAAEVQPDATLAPGTVLADQELGSGLAVAGGTIWATVLDYQGGTQSNGAVLEYTEPQGGWDGADTPENVDLLGAGSYSSGATTGDTLPGNTAAVAIDPTAGVLVAGAEDINPGDEGEYGGALVWQLSASTTTTTTTTTTTQTNTTPTPITPAKPTAARPTGSASVNGIPAAGGTLTCHADGWTGNPTLSYSWTLNGQTIAGANGNTLTLGKADANGTIVCSITGRNAGGSTTASSDPVSIGVCVVPTGSMQGDVLGPVHLGMAASDVFGLFPKQNQTHYGTQRFCVVGGDERVEFPTQKLLHSLKPRLRALLQQRVVMVLTANPAYQVDGVYHGMSVASARKQTRLGPAFRIGANTWYLIANHGDDVLIKTQHGIVQEIGFVDARLITAGGLVRFFSTFLNSGITL
jgi:hypothetical protein